jgi:hypothetical protein
MFIAPGLSAADTSNAEELVNFAFARYLGTGYYSTDESDVFVVQLPLIHQLRPMTPDEFGIVLRYPVTVGITNFDLDGDDSDDGQELPDIPELDDVATISLVPGVELQFAMRDNWYVAPFIDFGYAWDLDSDGSSKLFGAGVKSFADFTFNHDILTLGHRLLYSRQSNIEGDGSSSFSVLQSGLDYRFGAAAPERRGSLDIGLYYINNYYINDLGIPRASDDTINLGNTNEFGITFGLPPHRWLPDNPRIGLGVQLVDDLEVYRIVFGAPLF